MRPLIQTVALLFVFVVVHAAGAHAQQADSSYNALIHNLVYDKLHGAGHSASEIYTTDDSTTLGMLRGAGIPAQLVELHLVGGARTPHAQILSCPFLGIAPAGYFVVIAKTFQTDSASQQLHISVSCKEPRSGFGEGGAWDIHRVTSGWVVVREFNRFIT